MEIRANQIIRQIRNPDASDEQLVQFARQLVALGPQAVPPVLIALEQSLDAAVRMRQAVTQARSRGDSATLRALAPGVASNANMLGTSVAFSVGSSDARILPAFREFWQRYPSFRSSGVEETIHILDSRTSAARPTQPAAAGLLAVIQSPQMNLKSKTEAAIRLFQSGPRGVEELLAAAEIHADFYRTARENLAYLGVLNMEVKTIPIDKRYEIEIRRQGRATLDLRAEMANAQRVVGATLIAISVTKSCAAFPGLRRLARSWQSHSVEEAFRALQSCPGANMLQPSSLAVGADPGV